MFNTIYKFAEWNIIATCF